MPTLRRITLDELHDRRWELLALTSVGAFMAPLDGSIVAVALAKMGPTLHLSFGASIWVQAAYLLATAVLLIPLGRLADQHGRVRFYLAGVVVFTVGSLLAGLSMNGAWLIASRVLQGGGGALLAATSAAIVTAVFPPQERGKALGINVMAVYIGLAWGRCSAGRSSTTSAGAGSSSSTSRSASRPSPGAGCCCRAASARARTAPRNDLAGAALLGAFLVCLLVPLTFAPEWGWAAARTVISARRLGRSAWSASSTPSCTSRTRCSTLTCCSTTASSPPPTWRRCSTTWRSMRSASSRRSIWRSCRDGPAGLTGWLMVAQPAMMALLSPLAGRLSDRLGSRLLSTAGMVLVAAGMVLLATVPITAGIARVMVSLAVVGVGMAAFSAPNTSAIMGSVERSRLSLASAFLGTMRVTGQALSVAVLGAIAASQLGVSGSRLIYTGGQAASSGAHGASHGGSAAASVFAHVVQNYALGYKYAMFTGAGLALVGALASLTRPPQVPRASRPPLTSVTAGNER